MSAFGANAQHNGANAQLLDADAQLLSATAQLIAANAQREHLVGRDIVCFANDWSGDPLSKKHVMTRLAKHNRVLWVNSLARRFTASSSSGSTTRRTCSA